MFFHKEYYVKIASQLTRLSLVAAFAMLAGCATSPQPSPTGGKAPLAPVPSLKVAVDCGPCQVRPNVPALIAEGYREAAAKAGVQISTTSEATVTIKEYSDRNDAARFLAGAFAGKDEIRTVVTHNEKKFAVEDYYRNAWLGIESLAKKIGEMVFAQVR
jgi:hypothetical protein